LCSSDGRRRRSGYGRQAVDESAIEITAGRVPLSWLSNRRVAHARIKGRFVDVGDPDTLRWLAQRLTEVLVGAACATSTCRPRPAHSVS
jgi:hypothetical protein